MNHPAGHAIMLDDSHMRTLAYVSDEMYVALPDVLAEFEALDNAAVTILRSSPRGALRGDLPAGMYRVTLVKAGYGSKASTVEIGGEPVQLRLLSDGLLGYMWQIGRASCRERV